MTDRDRRPEGQYGFARGPKTEQARLPELARLVRPEKRDAIPTSAVFAPEVQTEAVSIPKAPKADSHGWVVRPKKPKPASVSAPISRLKAPNRRSPASVTHDLPASASQQGSKLRPRSWLVLGLVGMVYLVGIAGLWSMLRAFDDSAASTFTPAGDERTLPPLDESIEVRDAFLDDPVVPKFRPHAVVGISKNVAVSDLQKKQI